MVDGRCVSEPEWTRVLDQKSVIDYICDPPRQKAVYISRQLRNRDTGVYKGRG